MKAGDKMNIAVIFAGGTGARMHSKDKPKQFLEIHNKPIIIHTLEVFNNCEQVNAIVISCIEDWIPHLEKLIYKYRIDKVKKIVCGGKTGQLSIYNGLCAAKEISCGNDIVMIHDGVRPLINDELIEKNIECVKKHGSAITTSVVKETILVVNENGFISSVPERANSRLAKAPQSFWLEDIYGVHKQALADGREDFIDSCTMMQHYGHSLYLVDGPYENIKITTPDDFYTMRAFLDAKENAQLYGFGEQEEKNVL